MVHGHDYLCSERDFFVFLKKLQNASVPCVTLFTFMLVLRYFFGLLGIWLVSCPLALSQTLHAWIITDQRDSLIGATVDREAVTAWLEQAAEVAELELSLKEIDQNGVYGLQLRDELLSIRPKEDDVMLFYFSGHGSEQCLENTPPAFRMPGNACFAMDNIHATFVNKKARLVLVIFDCCTQRAPIVLPMRGGEESTLTEVAQANIRRLWRDYRGYLRIGSNDPDFGSFSYGNPQYGGLFTDTFLHQYNQMILADSCEWEGVLKSTRSEVSQYAANEGKVQVPWYSTYLRPIHLPLYPKGN